MAKAEIILGEGSGGGTPKVVAYAKGQAASGGSTVVYSEHGNDANYVTVSSDYNTITFVKAFKGIIGMDRRYGTLSGTLASSLQNITTSTTLNDTIYSFDASVGDTLIYAPQYNGGYEIIGC